MTKESFTGFTKLIKHDGRTWEIDHVSNQTVFFKTLFSQKDYNGKEQNKLDKNGLCRIPINWVEELILNGSYKLGD